MKNKYFNQIDELIKTIQNLPYKEWAKVGADRVLEILNKTKILKKN